MLLMPNTVLIILHKIVPATALCPDKRQHERYNDTTIRIYISTTLRNNTLQGVNDELAKDLEKARNQKTALDVSSAVNITLKLKYKFCDGYFGFSIKYIFIDCD